MCFVGSSHGADRLTAEFGLWFHQREPLLAPGQGRILDISGEMTAVRDLGGEKLHFQTKLFFWLW